MLTQPAPRVHSGCPSPRRRQTRGFTIIELIVAVALLAVLTGFAVPAFTAVINNNRLAGASNELAAALQSARIEAVRRGQRVIVCSTVNGTGCAAADAQWTGWLSFVDEDGNSSPQTSEILRVELVKLPIQLRVSPSISNSLDRIVFRPDGFAYRHNGNPMAANLSVCIATTRPADNIRDLTLTPGGSTTVARRSGSGACTDPSNP